MPIRFIGTRSTRLRTGRQGGERALVLPVNFYTPQLFGVRQQIPAQVRTGHASTSLLRKETRNDHWEEMKSFQRVTPVEPTQSLECVGDAGNEPMVPAIHSI
jgi:hypothetical protein